MTERTSPMRARSLVGNAIQVTKFSETEWRMLTPVQGASWTHQAEWRLKTSNTTPVSSSGPIWYLQGIYARNTAIPGDVQMSDSTNSSVYEYANKVGVTGAPEIGFEFFGNAHGGETLSAPIGVALDGVDISTFATGSTAYGLSVVFTQPKDFLLPKNPDGSLNLTTPIGSGTTTHTFSTTSLLVGFTFTFLAGFEGYGFYTNVMPNNFDNFNRVSINSGAATYAMVGDDSTQFLGTQVSDSVVYNTNTAANPYRMTMTIPGGAPCGSWVRSAPDNSFFVDNPFRGKIHSLFWTTQYSSRAALSPIGTITGSNQFVCSYVP